jgi:Zn-finger nucleic acid-binding protein
MAVKTRGGAEAYLETLDDVLGLGCQYVGRFCVEDMSMMMFARAFRQNGEIERASRCRGTDMLNGGYSVVYEVEAAPQTPPWGQQAKEVLRTSQWSRCWDTGRALEERIALGHAKKTHSYSDPTSALCNLCICARAFTESIC